MSEQVYDVPVEWAKRAFVDDAKYQAMYERSIADPERLLGRARQAHRLDQALHQGEEHLLRSAPRLDQMVRGRRAQRRRRTASTATSRSAATRSRSSGKATIPRTTARSPTASCTHEVCRFANVLKSARRQEGRPRHHLPADDPGGRLRDARLRAHRRDPFGGVRRLLARHRSPAASRTAKSNVVDHRRRGPARRPQGAAQGECRRGAERRRRRHQHDRGAPHRRAGRHEAGPRRLLRRDRQDRVGRVPVRADERRGPAVHPLHLGLDRQAQGRAAHHRRLPRLTRR